MIRDERGTTLMEVLVAIALLGITMAAIIGTVFASIASTKADRDRTNDQVTIEQAAEVLKDPGQNPFSCSGSYALPSGVMITSFEYWNAQTWVSGTAGCAAAQTGGVALERMTLKLDRDGRTASLVVVKRNT
jgi:type II secretory pathway pseudopilin PulG